MTNEEQLSISKFLSELRTCVIDQPGELLADEQTASAIDVVAVGEPTVRRCTVIQEYEVRRNGTCVSGVFSKTSHRRNSIDFPVCLDDEKAQREAANEFSVHAGVYDFCQNKPDYASVPKPIIYLQQYNTIFLEKANGTPLANLIPRRSGRTAGSFEQVEQFFRQTGKWLRQFHSMYSGNQLVAWDSQRFERRINDYVDRMRKVGINERFLQQIENRMKAISQELTGNDVHFGQLHGDFKSLHVLVDGKELSVIDFGSSRIDLCVQDVASFLSELENRSFWIRSAAGRFAASCKDEFLSGYSPSDAESKVISLLLALDLSRRWRKFRHRFPGGSWFQLIDPLIDNLKLRSPFNKLYVDRWFSKRIARALSLPLK